MVLYHCNYLILVAFGFDIFFFYFYRLLLQNLLRLFFRSQQTLKGRAHKPVEMKLISNSQFWILTPEFFRNKTGWRHYTFFPFFSIKQCYDTTTILYFYSFRDLIVLYKELCFLGLLKWFPHVHCSMDPFRSLD